MPIQELPCVSWSDFKGRVLPDLFGAVTVRRGQFYFRGQASSNWGLVSSFDRWYKSIPSPTKLPKKKATDRFISLFKDEVSRLTPDPGIGSNDEQVLALAQHYGLPTRLVDWTESPYVAAFFAFSGIAYSPEVTSHVAVWTLDTTSPIWQEDTGIKLLSIPSPYNERLKNQLGKFTLLQSPFDSVDEHVCQCDKTGLALRKITLPAVEAQKALGDLDFMGINYSTIYPGLDGCARAARLRVLLDPTGPGNS
jgi:hypothetical protein